MASRPCLNERFFSAQPVECEYKKDNWTTVLQWTHRVNISIFVSIHLFTHSLFIYYAIWACILDVVRRFWKIVEMSNVNYVASVIKTPTSNWFFNSLDMRTRSNRSRRCLARPWFCTGKWKLYGLYIFYYIRIHLLCQIYLCVTPCPHLVNEGQGKDFRDR